MYYILVISSCSAPKRVTALKKWLAPWCLGQSDLQSLGSSSHMPWEHWVPCRGTACYLHAHLACDNPRQDHSEQTRLFLKSLALFSSPFQSSAQFPALSPQIFNFCCGADRQTALSWSLPVWWTPSSFPRDWNQGNAKASFSPDEHRARSPQISRQGNLQSSLTKNSLYKEQQVDRKWMVCWFWLQSLKKCVFHLLRTEISNFL